MSVGVGLIGYGLAGSVFHAPLIGAVDGLQLRAVATSRPIDIAGARQASGLADLLADEAIDLIVIASPHATHFDLASAALGAGKHVVVDKPFTLTSDEADRLIALSARQARSVIPFHNRRWDGDYLTVRDFLRSGRAGEPARFEMHWDRFRPALREGWRESPDAGAGLLNDLGPHLIDQALQLFGWPDALSADMDTQRPGAAVDDYFALTLHYGPLRVILGATQIGVAPRPRFALHGSAGSLVKYGLDPQEARLKAGEGPFAPGFGEEDPSQFATFTDGEGRHERIPTRPGCYRDFYEAVALSILDGSPVPVEAVDARDGLEIIEIARRSSREGRRIDTKRQGG